MRVRLSSGENSSIPALKASSFSLRIFANIPSPSLKPLVVASAKLLRRISASSNVGFRVKTISLSASILNRGGIFLAFKIFARLASAPSKLPTASSISFAMLSGTSGFVVSNNSLYNSFSCFFHPVIFLRQTVKMLPPIASGTRAPSRDSSKALRVLSPCLLAPSFIN